MSPRQRRRSYVRWIILGALLGGVALSFGVVEGDVGGCGAPSDDVTAEALYEGFGSGSQPLQTLNLTAPRPFKAQLDPTLCDPNP